MTGVIPIWFQEWSDACEYANECALDLSVFSATSLIWVLLTAVISIYFWVASKLQNGATEIQIFHGPLGQREPEKSSQTFGDAATAIFVASIGALAQISSLQFLLFPELGALSNEVLRRPQGAWANSPFLLIFTPFIVGVIGILATQHISYGLLSILLTVITGMLVIRLLRSPITPAVSAGLLPLTLDETSWWYPPSLLIGASLLVAVATIRRKYFSARGVCPAEASHISLNQIVSKIDNSWIPFFAVFLLLLASGASLTGIRFLLFPPLVVIAIEMFAHVSVCPWAHRPLVLPIVCGLTASVGVIVVGWIGAGAFAVALIVISGTIILRFFALHVPSVIAIGLLPTVMANPDFRYGFTVLTGTAVLSLTFLFWRWMSHVQRHSTL